jgi:hypothetical protein
VDLHFRPRVLDGLAALGPPFEAGEAIDQGLLHLAAGCQVPVEGGAPLLVERGILARKHILLRSHSSLTIIHT